MTMGMNMTVSNRETHVELSTRGAWHLRPAVQMLPVMLAALSGAYAASCIGPLIEAMRHSLALSDNQIALLVGPALAFPVIVAAMPVGVVVDRFQRIRLLRLCAVVLVVGLFLSAFASDFKWILVARGMVGVASSAIAIATTSLVADLYPPARRGRARAILTIGQAAGGASAYGLGGYLLVNLGFGDEGWRWTLAWLAVPLIVIAGILLFAKEPVRTGVVIRNPSFKQVTAEFHHLGRGLALLMAGIIATQVSGAAVNAWAAPTLARTFNLAPDHVGAVIGATILFAAPIGAFGGGVIADMCQKAVGPRLTVQVLALITLFGAPGALFAIAPSSPWAIILMTMYLVVEGAAIGMAYTVLTIIIPNELRGIGFAILTVAGSIFATGLAPLMVSTLASHLGGAAMIGEALSGVAVCACLAAVGAYLLASMSIHGGEIS